MTDPILTAYERHGTEHARYHRDRRESLLCGRGWHPLWANVKGVREASERRAAANANFTRLMEEYLEQYR